MSILMIEIALDFKAVFHVFLDYVGICICCRGVITVIFLAFLVPKTSLLVFLVFFASLALVSGRLLVFFTKYISRKSVSGLSSFKVLLLFFLRAYSPKNTWNQSFGFL